jgi:hypothetical protein
MHYQYPAVSMDKEIAYTRTEEVNRLYFFHAVCFCVAFVSNCEHCLVFQVFPWSSSTEFQEPHSDRVVHASTSPYTLCTHRAQRPGRHA